MSKGTIFFDYDGTLHDSMKVYAPAFRAGYAWLVENGHAQPREFDDEWLSHWLGWTTRDMWTTFMPELPEDVWRQAAHIVGAEMDRLSETGQGRLFPGIAEALDKLREADYELVFLSNCRHTYRDAHKRFHGLDRWMSAYYCADDFPGEPKWRIYQHAMVERGFNEPCVMVGDRFHDIEVATKNEIPSIGCAYGFGLEGELDAATVRIDSPAALPAAVEEVLR